MKKVNVLLVTVSIALTSFAQPQAGSLGVEVNFDPFKAITPTFSIDGLSVRYFISGDLAVRGSLNFASSPNTAYSYVTVGTDETEFKTKTNVTTFGFTPGVEYHLVKFEKGSLYAGAEIGYALTSASASTTNNKNDDGRTLKGSDDAGNRSQSAFGLAVFTGVNYYLTKNLYLGAELGLGYSSSKNKEIVEKTTTGGTSTETTDKDYSKNGNIGFAAVPTFRLGWNF
ncbi:MAG: outer membrane beta-barrel protein [Prevotellaceae bacterium]|jgi:opacity protein-like surface antigen|nr:outer membrane beta-barrel protein [Prevotellaceae bacterium]